MTWKERRTITILSSILLVLVIALLIVLGIRYRQSRETPVDSTEASGDALLTTADEYTSLSYYNGSATLSFSLDETGTWLWIDDPWKATVLLTTPPLRWTPRRRREKTCT